MATHRPSIFADYLPDVSGQAFVEPYDVKATNDNWKFPVKIFNDSATKDSFHGFFHVTQNNIDSSNLIVKLKRQ